MGRWIVAACLLFGTPAMAAAQTGAGPSPGASTASTRGANSPSDTLPAEYDPGADRHYLLPTGRLAPVGTATVGAGGLGLPPAAAPFVSGSFLRRTAIAAAVVVEPVFTGTTFTGSVAVQPLSIGKFDASVTLAGVSIDDEDVDFRGGAIVAAASYGSDRNRATVALGSLRCCGESEPFLAVGGDVEVAGGTPRVAIVGGRPRTVRKRVKLIAEAYSPVGDGLGDGILGLVGTRYSSESFFVNVVIPFAIEESGSGGAWLPLVSVGFAF